MLLLHPTWSKKVILRGFSRYLNKVESKINFEKLIYINKKSLFSTNRNSDLIEVLNLGEMPLCDDLIPIGSKKESKRYPAKIRGKNINIFLSQSLILIKFSITTEIYDIL